MGPWIRSVIVYKYVYKGVIGWAILLLDARIGPFSWCRDILFFQDYVLRSRMADNGRLMHADWFGKDTTGGLEHFYIVAIATLMIPYPMALTGPRYLFVLFEASGI
jgi:hypothetical protein